MSAHVAIRNPGQPHELRASTPGTGLGLWQANRKMARSGAGAGSRFCPLRRSLTRLDIRLARWLLNLDEVKGVLSMSVNCIR